MRAWEADKRWSDIFLPEIKRIIGETFIVEPPKEEDEERNTDLIVLKFDSIRIACRIRKNEYYKRYPDDFTIRAGRPSGTKTELTKIIEGWGDYLFYGFSDEYEKTLSGWKIIDLNAFRLFFNRYIARHKGEIPGHKKHNTDGSSYFLTFDTKKYEGLIYSENQIEYGVQHAR